MANPDTADKPGTSRRFGKGPFKGRTLRQHIIRRLIMVLPLTALMIVVAKTGMLDRVVDHYTFRQTSWFDDTALVQHLRTMVTHNGMTGDRPECLLFVVDGNSPPDATKIEVMEKHSGSCPNPDGSLPRLFTLKVDRTGQRIYTDQGDPGTFHPVR